MEYVPPYWMNWVAKTKTNSGAPCYGRQFFGLGPVELLWTNMEQVLANNAKLQTSIIAKGVEESQYELPDPASLTNEWVRSYLLKGKVSGNLVRFNFGPLRPGLSAAELELCDSLALMIHASNNILDICDILKVSMKEYEV